MISNDVRKPAVAGQFYPAEPRLLAQMIDELFSQAVAYKGLPVRALIVPHAGFVFSGLVAASAFNQLHENASWDNIFVIGASHHQSFKGASVCTLGYYSTPFGKVKVNSQLANELIHGCKYFSYQEEADQLEHSLEVQLPFLQQKLKQPFQLVPILLGTDDPTSIHELAKILRPWFNPNNLFVLSTDFSHYPNDADAQRVDKATLEAVLSMDSHRLRQQLVTNQRQGVKGLLTSLCGASAVYLLLELAKANPGLKLEHLHYQNSSESKYGDTKRVVGYNSLALFDSSNAVADELSVNEKKLLLAWARNAIKAKLHKQPLQSFEDDKNHDAFSLAYGAFVSLHLKGKLKGCVGRFNANKPLYQTIHDMALAAAFEDDRFDPLKAHELEGLVIEISVLTPMQRVYEPSQIVLGRDGIYIKKGFRSGTFLPQVATSTHWTVEEFLGHCSADKAGIGWDGWKTAELYTYQAIVFSEDAYA